MLLFDIGANVGMWALNNYTSTTKIICVEASPTTFLTLKANTSGKNIECLNYAVSNSSESTVNFFESSMNVLSTLDESWLNNPSSRFFNRTSYKKIEVNSMTLDKLIEDYGIPDLLKVDVEGAENIVLKSLSTKVPLLCFEWAAEWNKKTVEAIEHLLILGYTQFHIQTLDTYTYRPSSYELNKETIFDSISSRKGLDWGMIWAI
jgi:FkbM family methyltransferase